VDSARVVPSGAAPSSTAQAAEPAPAAEPSEESMADQDDAAAEMAESEGGAATLAPPSVGASAGSRRALSAELVQLQRERTETTNLWPWLTVGAGVTAVVVATAVGAAKTFSCDPGCEAPPWVGLVAVVGATVGTAGAIWLVRVDHDIRELELQKRKVETDLQQLDIARLRMQRGTRAAPAVSLHWSF
jgi:hypothetical protein